MCFIHSNVMGIDFTFKSIAECGSMSLKSFKFIAVSKSFGFCSVFNLNTEE